MTASENLNNEKPFELRSLLEVSTGDRIYSKNYIV